eukprot:GEMP01065728.1.p1 GENE.GEMP01065728.1~~GEMP01065728.1.p1  ORF type:complete len:200 (-),score=24.39 GEMP01065728.1:182-781(-)
MMGRPRGVQEIQRAFETSGIQPGSHVVRDGWRATVAVDLEGMQMTRTMANHAQGELVVQDLEAPFPEELAFFTTNHVEARWSALKRWLRKRCGGKMPKVDEWGRYIREYQWKQWGGGPIIPRMIDSVRAHSAAIIQTQIDQGRAEAYHWDVAHPIDLLSSESPQDGDDPMDGNAPGGQVIDLPPTDMESIESSSSDDIW